MNEQFRTMHLFAGAGGGILADLILGHQPVVAVEWDKYACNVLRERAADGWFDGLDVWEGDVREFAAHDWQGRVDCIHAGFPCQDISTAGNQAGVAEGTRSGLYREVLRIADVIRPEYIFLENVAAITTLGDGAVLRTVVGDLAKRGYDAVWICLSAAEVGANHKRNRWWLLAYPVSIGTQSKQDNQRKSSEWSDSSDIEQISNTKSKQCDGSDHFGKNSQSSTSELRNCDSKRDVPDTNLQRGELPIDAQRGESNSIGSSDGRWEAEINNDKRSWWEVEPDVGRVAHGIPSASHRLKALGNAQVPLQCATAFSLLWEIAFDGQDRTN